MNCTDCGALLLNFEIDNCMHGKCKDCCEEFHLSECIKCCSESCDYKNCNAIKRIN